MLNLFGKKRQIQDKIMEVLSEILETQAFLLSFQVEQKKENHFEVELLVKMRVC